MEWHRPVSMTTQVKLLLPFVRLVVLHVPPVASGALHAFSLHLKFATERFFSDVISSLWEDVVKDWRAFRGTSAAELWYLYWFYDFPLYGPGAFIWRRTEPDGTVWWAGMIKHQSSNSSRRGLLSEQIGSDCTGGHFQQSIFKTFAQAVILNKS